MGKKNGIYSFAEVEVDGRTWDFELPPYLDGAVECGTVVVVDGETPRVGMVVRLKAHTDHRPENVRMVIDKVRTARFERLVGRRSREADLMAAAEGHLEQLNRLQALEAKAEDDPKMRSLVDALKAEAQA